MEHEYDYIELLMDLVATLEDEGTYSKPGSDWPDLYLVYCEAKEAIARFKGGL